ncbi:MAG: putative lipoprotein YajG [Rickettsiales bacterium]|jgi:uncharacterized lipoprotein YajG
MKKILTLLALVGTLSSCVNYNQENLNLNLSVDSKFNDFGKNQNVDLSVVDGRSNIESIGDKRLGKDLINIKSTQNLTVLIKNKIARDLEQNGFLINDNTDKSLEIKILTLNYSAYREFFIGSSKIEILLKITALNGNKSSYSTTQNFSLSQKHFIMPLITTDEKTINKALQESLDGVIANQKLLNFLKN